MESFEKLKNLSNSEKLKFFEIFLESIELISDDSEDPKNTKKLDVGTSFNNSEKNVVSDEPTLKKQKTLDGWLIGSKNVPHKSKTGETSGLSGDSTIQEVDSDVNKVSKRLDFTQPIVNKLDYVNSLNLLKSDEISPKIAKQPQNKYQQSTSEVSNSIVNDGDISPSNNIESPGIVHNLQKNVNYAENHLDTRSLNTHKSNKKPSKIAKHLQSNRKVNKTSKSVINNIISPLITSQTTDVHNSQEGPDSVNHTINHLNDTSCLSPPKFNEKSRKVIKNSRSKRNNILKEVSISPPQPNIDESTNTVCKVKDHLDSVKPTLNHFDDANSLCSSKCDKKSLKTKKSQTKCKFSKKVNGKNVQFILPSNNEPTGDIVCNSQEYLDSTQPTLNHLNDASSLSPSKSLKDIKYLLSKHKINKTVKVIVKDSISQPDIVKPAHAVACNLQESLDSVQPTLNHLDNANSLDPPKSDEKCSKNEKKSQSSKCKISEVTNNEQHAQIPSTDVAEFLQECSDSVKPTLSYLNDADSNEKSMKDVKKPKAKRKINKKTTSVKNIQPSIPNTDSTNDTVCDPQVHLNSTQQTLNNLDDASFLSPSKSKEKSLKGPNKTRNKRKINTLINNNVKNIQLSLPNIVKSTDETVCNEQEYLNTTKPTLNHLDDTNSSNLSKSNKISLKSEKKAQNKSKVSKVVSNNTVKDDLISQRDVVESIDSVCNLHKGLDSIKPTQNHLTDANSLSSSKPNEKASKEATKSQTKCKVSEVTNNIAKNQQISPSKTVEIAGIGNNLQTKRKHIEAPQHQNSRAKIPRKCLMCTDCGLNSKSSKEIVQSLITNCAISPIKTDALNYKKNENQPVDNLNPLATRNTRTRKTSLNIQDAVESKTKDSVESKTTDSAESEITNLAESKTTDLAESETTDSVELKTTDSDKSKTTDSVKSKPKGSVKPKPKDSVKPKPKDSVESKPKDVVESKPKDVGESKLKDSIESKPRNSVESKPKDSVESKSKLPNNVIKCSDLDINVATSSENMLDTIDSSSLSNYKAFHILEAECSHLGLNFLDILQDKNIQNVLKNQKKYTNDSIFLINSFKSSCGENLPLVHLIESKKKLYDVLSKLRRSK